MIFNLKFPIALTSCCIFLGLFAESTSKTNAPVMDNSTGSQAVAYQINPAHTGSQSDTVAPPLVKRWSRDLGGPISYPLIAEGKVFVTVRIQNQTGPSVSKLYALDASTGATAWGPIDLAGTRGWSASAYDAGRIFALNYDGDLRAFDAASGALFWEKQLMTGPNQVWAFDSAPTALSGFVYTAGARNGVRYSRSPSRTEAFSGRPRSRMEIQVHRRYRQTACTSHTFVVRLTTSRQLQETLSGIMTPHAQEAEV